MGLEDFDVTIQTIIDELSYEQKEAGKRRVVTRWRTKLEQEPTRLPPYQIDHIMREVRRRLGNGSR